MKNRTTSVALKIAMISATGKFRPREPEVRSRHVELLELFLVFEELDDEERQAERDGEQQPPDGRALLAGLRRANPQRHRQAASDEHDGVEAAKVDIELFAT